MDESEELTPKGSSISEAQKLQIEKKRLKALELRKAKVLARSPHNRDESGSSGGHSRRKPAKAKISLPRVIDSGGGFLIEEDSTGDVTETKKQAVYDEGPPLAGDTAVCDECGKPFFEAYLHTKFAAFVCDPCRGKDQGKHKLVTKSDAKSKYLLQDSDIDRREPPLKYVLRKNPRNDTWGDMKLYYEPQVHKRAIEVWGSEEAIEAEKEQRKVNRVKAKQKQFDKKMKELKMSVRSSLYKKNTDAHSHEYGPETCVSEEAGEFEQTCATCGHVLVFEKL